MKRPIIGIAPSQFDGVIKMKANYAEAILAAGGVPVFLPYTVDPDRIALYTEMCDGLLFAGGVDVHPKYYGEEIEFESVEVVDLRDEFELALFPAYFATKKPIMGICRGIQSINVALGGSLIQHMDGHKQTKDEDGYPTPRIANVVAGTRLHGIVGQDVLRTNSYHHQAIKTVADGLDVAARADDGVVEAVEYPEHPFLVAVQWHPEMFYKNDEAAAKLFRAFVGACRGE